MEASFIASKGSTRPLRLDNKEMEAFLKDLVESGGEGIILRKMASIYQNGRSRDLFKLKVIHFNPEHNKTNTTLKPNS